MQIQEIRFKTWENTPSDTDIFPSDILMMHSPPLSISSTPCNNKFNAVIY